MLVGQAGQNTFQAAIEFFHYLQFRIFIYSDIATAVPNPDTHTLLF